MTPETLTLSPLPHTWILDVDGTLCVHNGHLNGGDELLPGVKEFMEQLPEGDMVVLITSRKEEQGPALEAFLHEHGIRYDHIIYGAPMGERILVNDDKPSGLCMAYAVRQQRDGAWDIHWSIDKEV